VPSTALGSSSLGFAAPLSTLARCRVGPQGLPSRGPPQRCITQLERVPRDLRLISRAATSRPEELRRRCRRPRSSPLVGFVRVNPPLLRHRWWSQLPAVLPLPSAGPAPAAPTCSVLVVSHHLDGLLLPPGPGLVASRYRKGFAAFPLALAARSPDAPKSTRWRPAQTQAFPLRASHPPKKSPRQQPRRVTATLASSPSSLRARAVLRPRCPLTLDLEALLRCRVRTDRRSLPSDHRPLLPWASFPSRVLARTARPDPKRLRSGPYRALPPSLGRHCCRPRSPSSLPP
jgi:hypothetical protein